MKVFGIHWMLSGGNRSMVDITVDDEPDAPAGKWEVHEAYAKMKKPTVQLMTLTVQDCQDLVKRLKKVMKEEGFNTDNW